MIWYLTLILVLSLVPTITKLSPLTLTIYKLLATIKFSYIKKTVIHHHQFHTSGTHTASSGVYLWAHTSGNQSIQSRQQPGVTFRTSINTEVATFPLYYRHRGTARHLQSPAGSQYIAGHKISSQQLPQMMNRKRERAESSNVSPRLPTADCPEATPRSPLTHVAVSRPKLGDYAISKFWVGDHAYVTRLWETQVNSCCTD